MKKTNYTTISRGPMARKKLSREQYFTKKYYLYFKLGSLIFYYKYLSFLLKFFFFHFTFKYLIFLIFANYQNILLLIQIQVFYYFYFYLFYFFFLIKIKSIYFFGYIFFLFISFYIKTKLLLLNSNILSFYFLRRRFYLVDFYFLVFYV